MNVNIVVSPERDGRVEEAPARRRLMPSITNATMTATAVTVTTWAQK